MAKDPRFNFFPDNWSGGTKRMSFEQKGAYLELIMLNFYCFSDGLPGFTEDEAVKSLASAAAYTVLWDFLKPKFKTDGKYFWSERMYKEFQKAKIHSEKQSERANKRWASKPADAAASACNGTGYGNGSVFELKGVQGENFITVDDRRVHDPLPILEFNQVTLNGIQSEHKLRSWKDVVPEWFKSNLQTAFNDEKHLLNSFKKYYMNFGRAPNGFRKTNGVTQKFTMKDLES